ncbi:hypothetical protein BC830DRAFT_949083 [Chytriomyces sp. MP71]|nr:hypothetical protein BC830DRAFT_949083 [Chytriomyces sp. MP71]
MILGNSNGPAQGHKQLMVAALLFSVLVSMALLSAVDLHRANSKHLHEAESMNQDIVAAFTPSPPIPTVEAPSPPKLCDPYSFRSTLNKETGVWSPVPSHRCNGTVPAPVDYIKQLKESKEVGRLPPYLANRTVLLLGDSFDVSPNWLLHILRLGL